MVGDFTLMANTRVRVNPDGPVPCNLAICGEAPSKAELAEGRGFAGPSGRILWGGDFDLIGSIVGRPRETCYVTNVSKRECDDAAWQAMPYSAREAEYVALREELERVQPKLVLAFGRRAAIGLCPGFSSMSVDSGIARQVGAYAVMPLWHPSAYLRGDHSVIGKLATALARVPELLAHGVPEREPWQDSDTPPDFRCVEEFFDTWPSEGGFLTRKSKKAVPAQNWKKKDRCTTCGLSRRVLKYEDEERQWRLCCKCAWRMWEWVNGQDNCRE